MEKRKTIGCVLTAIENDIIQGDFNEKFTEFSFKTIQTKNQADEISAWTIKVVPYDTEKEKIIRFKQNMLKCPESGGLKQLPDNIIGRYYVENKTHTGKIRDHDVTDITTGKNIDKKNATTSVGQAILMANKLYQDKLNKSSTAKKQTSDRPLPMLVKKEGSDRKATLTDDDFERGIIVEPKLDGLRLVSHITSGNDTELYSRTGKVFFGLDNISRNVTDVLYKQNLYHPQDIYLDGEVYLHGKQLQDISGAVRGEGAQSGTVSKSDLKYYIFDCFLPTQPGMEANDRKELLDKLLAIGPFDSLVLVKGPIVHSREEMVTVYEDYIEKGYEGAIARRLDRPYVYSRNNYHSDALLKIKPVESAEFEIAGYKQGRGKDLGAVIFEMKTADGKKFTAPAKMDYAQRKAIFKSFLDDPDVFKNDYLHKMATVEYTQLSRLGIPLQPHFIVIRDYE